MGKIVFTRKKLIEYSYLLGNGIDPLTNKKFDEDTILNDVIIKQYHQNIYNVLRNDNTFFPIDFINLFNDTKERTISEFINYIKSNVLYTNNLSIKDISNKLFRDGFLKEEKTDKYIFRVPTTNGEKIGIKIKKIEKEGSYYGVNYYNINAQKYIFNNYIKSILIKI